MLFFASIDHQICILIQILKATVRRDAGLFRYQYRIRNIFALEKGSLTFWQTKSQGNKYVSPT